MGGRNLVRALNIVVSAIFDSMTVEIDWREEIGESRNSNPHGRCEGERPLAARFDLPHLLLSSRSGSINMALSPANCSLKENVCTAG